MNIELTPEQRAAWKRLIEDASTEPVVQMLGEGFYWVRLKDSNEEWEIAQHLGNGTWCMLGDDAYHSPEAILQLGCRIKFTETDAARHCYGGPGCICDTLPCSCDEQEKKQRSGQIRG